MPTTNKQHHFSVRMVDW